MVKVFIYKDYDLIEEIDRIIDSSRDIPGWQEKTEYIRKELQRFQDNIKKAAEIVVKNNNCKEEDC